MQCVGQKLKLGVRTFKAWNANLSYNSKTTSKSPMLCNIEVIMSLVIIFKMSVDGSID
jgi:hypothetical protein